MDFLIMLGLNALFDLLWPQYKQRSQGRSDDVAAAFWFGTSFENLDGNNSYKEPTENSDYDSYVDW